MKAGYDDENQTNGNLDLPEFNRLASRSDARGLGGLQRFSTFCSANLNELKQRVTEQLVAEYGNSVSAALLTRAVREADAIAATTPFPSLFLPTLAEEKVQLAYAWRNRQTQIREQSLALTE